MESPSNVRGEEITQRGQNMGDITNERHNGSYNGAESHIALQVTPTVCFRGFHNRSHHIIKENTV